MWGKKKIQTIVLEKIVPDGKIKGYDMPFTYQFVGEDRKNYMILWTKDMDKINLKIYDIDEHKEMFAHLDARIWENNYWSINPVDVGDNHRRIGLGTALMKAFFEIVTYLYFEIQINTIKGTIRAKIKLKDALKFYKSFDKYKTESGKIIKMQYNSETEEFVYTF